MRLLLLTALVAVTILVLSCGDSPTSSDDPPPSTDPVPGWLKIRMSSPNADDGGILFLVSGGQIDSVRTAFPDLFVSDWATTAKRIIVAGDLTSGIVVEIKVPDVASVTSYAAVLEQVASREAFEQQQVSGYSLVVER